jgi:hypothetical protein
LISAGYSGLERAEGFAMTVTSQILGSLITTKAGTGFGVFLIAWVIYTFVYRRYFHPLAKVPGPFWPAVTTLAQTYHNGNYYKKIEEYHKKYGMNAFFCLLTISLIRYRSNRPHSAK